MWRHNSFWNMGAFSKKAYFNVGGQFFSSKGKLRVGDTRMRNKTRHICVDCMKKPNTLE